MARAGCTLIVLAAAVLPLATCMLIQPGGGDAERWARDLAPRRAQCIERANLWQQSGILVKERQELGVAAVRVDRSWWVGRSSSERTEAALILYCAWMPPTGQLGVTIRDMDGQKLGTLTNGNWFEGW